MSTELSPSRGTKRSSPDSSESDDGDKEFYRQTLRRVVLEMVDRTLVHKMNEIIATHEAQHREAEDRMGLHFLGSGKKIHASITFSCLKTSAEVAMQAMGDVDSVPPLKDMVNSVVRKAIGFEDYVRKFQTGEMSPSADELEVLRSHKHLSDLWLETPVFRHIDRKTVHFPDKSILASFVASNIACYEPRIDSCANATLWGNAIKAARLEDACGEGKDDGDRLLAKALPPIYREFCQVASCRDIISLVEPDLVRYSPLKRIIDCIEDSSPFGAEILKSLALTVCARLLFSIASHRDRANMTLSVDKKGRWWDFTDLLHDGETLPDPPTPEDKVKPFNIMRYCLLLSCLCKQEPVRSCTRFRFFDGVLWLSCRTHCMRECRAMGISEPNEEEMSRLIKDIFFVE